MLTVVPLLIVVRQFSSRTPDHHAITPTVADARRWMQRRKINFTLRRMPDARHWNLPCGLSVATTPALAIDGYPEKNSRQLSKLEYEIGPDERSERPKNAILGIKA
jgi:hypothetical protein